MYAIATITTSQPFHMFSIWTFCESLPGITGSRWHSGLNDCGIVSGCEHAVEVPMTVTYVLLFSQARLWGHIHALSTSECRFLVSVFSPWHVQYLRRAAFGNAAVCCVSGCGTSQMTYSRAEEVTVLSTNTVILREIRRWRTLWHYDGHYVCYYLVLKCKYLSHFRTRLVHTHKGLGADKIR